ncbi:unnamed protein product [Cyclocybe aegerita]|uniref:Uncharacterized protein n=1 Tax=Cyclocybe aegerita TaxID=1973307 RepID=A0A8S0WUE2_CYCAE|nr:unnamed protein product [Cyclocybe aegerita]
MPGVVDGNGPSYISAHSADVILSDIRPIKLRADALRAINVFLDEFLHNILSTSRSLATDKLRASLLSLLPTSLGKEALLEAEVELRAYWERTEPKPLLEDDGGTFHLQWAFELLRFKCEAYSTLNEEDEDPAAESRVNERFAKVHPHPPKVALLDPAALYLTAIIESMCEHILSNVGRVAARDSSRTYATVNDLFIALCEDDSIYGLFRAMKVYQQIEHMAQPPLPTRKKSVRRDRLSISRTSSPNDLTLVNSDSSRTRHSLDGQSTTMPISPANSTSRPSFEKVKAIRMFANSKTSGEGGSQNGHKKSESIKSESSRHLPDDIGSSPTEDAAMLREFDDLMRSASTMKVSLTPDRLKTMEVYKQEKDQRNTSRRHFSSNSEPEFPSNSQRPSLRQVHSIKEDEELHTGQKSRSRQASVATPPTLPLAGAAPARARSVSTSGTVSSSARKPTRSPSATIAPSAYSNPVAPAVDMVQGRDYRLPKVPDNNGFPQRTRVRQRNRESLDLDDVMNGSDDDQEPLPPPRGNQIVRSPPSTPRRAAPHAVSASTRELMDFLAEGPPEPKLSKSGKELVDFLAEGPPDYGASMQSLETTKSKGTGRLQRMISKLNLGNGEKTKAVPDSPRTPHAKQAPSVYAPVRPVITSKTSQGTLSSLANRPIPPRMPRPISPPASPSQDSSQSDENKSVGRSIRKPYQDTVSREPSYGVEQSPIIDRPRPALPSAPTPPLAPAPLITPAASFSRGPAPQAQSPQEKSPQEKPPPRPLPIPVPSNGNARTNPAPVPAPVKEGIPDSRPVVPVRTTSHPTPVSSPVRKPPPPVVAPPPPSIAELDLRAMQRLFSNATSADECRLIFDMFMARSGISRGPKAQDVPYPSPPPSIVKHTPYTGPESSLESSLVHLFLGGSASSEPVPQLPSSNQEPPPDGLPTPRRPSASASQNTPAATSHSMVPTPA